MNPTQAPNLPEFGDSLLGILAAIALAVLLSALAYALAAWPAEAARWTALLLVVACGGLGGLAPRWWPGR